MLSFPPAVRIWLATTPADLRKSFDGLAELVRQHLDNDPLSGHLFVFRNKRSDRVKLLYWDEDGFVIVYKRLEEGTFRFPPVGAGQASVTLRAAELAMLLDGVDWQNARRSKRYHRPASAAV
jgi:transposase